MILNVDTTSVQGLDLAGPSPGGGDELVVRSISDLAAFEDALPALGQMPTESFATVFTTPAWLHDWWCTVGRDRDVGALLVQDAESVRFLLVCEFDRQRRVGVPLIAAQTPASVWGEIGLAAGAAPPMLDSWLDWLYARERWAMAKIGVFEASEGHALADHCRDRGFAVREVPTRIPVVDVDCDWDAFLRKRSKNFRRNLKRKRAALPEGAAVEHTWSPTAEQVVESCRDAARGSWQGAEGVAAIDTPGVADFYTRLAEGGPARGTLLLSSLRIDGRLAGNLLGTVWNGTYYAFDTAFDASFEHLSPGLLIHLSLFEALCASPVERVYLGFDAPYKDRFSPDHLEGVEICLYRSRWVGRLHRGRTAIRERFRAWIGEKEVQSAASGSKPR